MNNLGGWAPDGGNTSDGMVVKRMTTIGQPEGWSNPNDLNFNNTWFDDGSKWGFDANNNPAVHWYNSQIGYNSDNTATTLYTNPWDATGGYQNFPDDTTRIVYTNVSPSEEFDAINLHY